MVPTNDYYPDRSYIFAFLLSSRLFVKPYQLLSKIWDLSQQQQNLKSFIQVSFVAQQRERNVNFLFFFFNSKSSLRTIQS
jgi:DNA-binding transcriptional regulator PaaX